jgi:hypothetical protein
MAGIFVNHLFPASKKTLRLSEVSSVLIQAKLVIFPAELASTIPGCAAYLSIHIHLLCGSMAARLGPKNQCVGVG